MKKKFENGFHSYADMNSERFDKRLLENQSTKKKDRDTIDSRQNTVNMKVKVKMTKISAKNRNSLDKLIDLELGDLHDDNVNNGKKTPNPATERISHNTPLYRKSSLVNNRRYLIASD